MQTVTPSQEKKLTIAMNNKNYIYLDFAMLLLRYVNKYWHGDHGSIVYNVKKQDIVWMN